MSRDDLDTIAAIASPPGPGARGVIRISGARARELVEATVRFAAAVEWVERWAARGRFDDGRGTQPVLVLWMPAPRSYTGEDVAELHLAGAPPLLAAALARVLALGARHAAPGEFTRRAFEGGRIDLTRAEGVLALTEAASEAERRAATALLLGGLAERVTALRARIVEVRALVEASLDFDETDAIDVPRAEIEQACRSAARAVSEVLGYETRRASPTAAPRVALVGAPNAGKTSLFNWLTGADAIVSPRAGTTRDALRGVWRVAGVDCDLWDTAGLGALGTLVGDDPDSISQRVAREHHNAADLWLVVVDATRSDAGALSRPHGDDTSPAERILVWTHVDRPGAPPEPPREVLEASGARAHAAVSPVARTGRGELEARVAQALGLGGAGARPARPEREISQRHRAALECAAREIEGALAALARAEPLDLIGERARAAADALDAISGRTTPEDVLELLFARFCVGK